MFSPFPTLAHSQECKGIQTNCHRTPSLHHDCLGAMCIDRCMGLGYSPGLPPPAVLSNMLATLIDNQILTGLLTAGVLAAIMSSLDSQFLCLGTIFTNDIVLHKAGKDKYSDKQIVKIARLFIVAIVALTYALAMALKDANVFDLAVWCFSGFGALFPVVFAALYWKRALLKKVRSLASLRQPQLGSTIFKKPVMAANFSLDRHRSSSHLLCCCGNHDAGCFPCYKTPSQETLNKFFKS